MSRRSACRQSICDAQYCDAPCVRCTTTCMSCQAVLRLATCSVGQWEATPPPPQIGEQIGGPIFRQNRFPVPWISVAGPKHTFLLVALQLESCGNPKYLSIFKKKNRPSVSTWSLSSAAAVQGGGPVVYTLTLKLASVDSIPGPVLNNGGVGPPCQPPPPPLPPPVTRHRSAGPLVHRCTQATFATCNICHTCVTYVT